MTNDFIGIAPGRVNLIGEHTDYNGGWVLPTAIPQRTVVRLSPRGDGVVEAFAAAERPGASSRFGSYTLGKEEAEDTWLDYVKGVTSVLRGAGAGIGGASIRIESTVPEGSGLSSSAALSIALLKAWRAAYALPLDDVALARLAQKAENEFVGARVGVMDPMAVCFARPGFALFLDTRTLAYEEVALPAGLELLVIGSGISHRNVGGGYNQRRSECEEACKLLGVKELRDLSADADLSPLPDLLRRRARHVLTENQRVHDAVAALKTGDTATLGRLLNESHESLRGDYEVSIPEIDTLVGLCRGHREVFGARLTGGGFGGSIVAAVRSGEARSVGALVAREYREKTGARAAVLVPEEGPAEPKRAPELRP